MSIQDRRDRRFAPEWLFLALGALAFAVDGLRVGAGPEPDSDRQLIVLPVVPDGESLFDAEAGATDPEQWLRNEVLFREAERLQLGHGDLIVRRRLVQKMEYLLDGLSAIPEPSEAELADFHRRHLDRYPAEPRYVFEHRYFTLAGGLEAARARAQTALRMLERSGATASVGDPYPASLRLSGVAPARLRQLFGEELPAALEQAPVGRWFGPHRGKQGLHLLRLESREAGGAAALTEVYPQVVRDYYEDHRRRERERHYQQLRGRYLVRQP